MSNKQSNKQTQNVKVVVNNNLKECCDKPKPKRRKPQRKPKEQDPAPMDEFPTLYTPQARNGTPSISAMPNRQGVYLPPSIQITNQGSQYPVPEYFDRHYTNLTRTIEDFAQMIRKEQQDVNDLVNIDTNEDTSQPTISRTKYDIQQDEGLASTSRTPVKQLTKVFEPEPVPELEVDVAKPYVPINQEEQIIATSPEHSVLIKRYNDLYKDWEKTKKYSRERKLAFDEIKVFAEELELNLNNPNSKPRSAEQLRTDIRKAIEMFK